MTTFSFFKFGPNDGDTMRNTNLRNFVLPMSLLAIMTAAATTACSTGSGSDSTGSSGATGSSGTTGSAGSEA